MPVTLPATAAPDRTTRLEATEAPEGIQAARLPGPSMAATLSRRG